MIEAYESGDPYIAFGKQAGLIPPGGTKSSHPVERQLCKSCVLGVLFGMSEIGLSLRIKQPKFVARDLLEQHRRVYPTFWKWIGEVSDHFALHGYVQTVFGWPLHALAGFNPRSVQNFPMQANAAEMLRLAVISATEDGLEIAAPIHDALLLVAPLDALEEQVKRLVAHMEQASSDVLNGPTVRVDIETVRYPDRYIDEAGVNMWDRVMKMVNGQEVSA